MISVVIGILTGAFLLYNQVDNSSKSTLVIKELNSLSGQGLNIAYNSGFDTTYRDDSFIGYHFPFENLSSSLPLIKTPSYSKAQWFKSPFGGAVTTSIYSSGRPSVFNGFHVRVEMEKFDANSCVKIMTSQLYNPNVDSFQVGFGDTILSTNQKGERNKTDSELRKDISNRCDLVYDEAKSGNVPVTLFFTYK